MEVKIFCLKWVAGRGDFSTSWDFPLPSPTVSCDIMRMDSRISNAQISPHLIDQEVGHTGNCQPTL